MTRSALLALSALAITVPVFAAEPLQVTSSVMTEAKARAADGTTRVTLVPARRVVPGDRVVFVVAYRNVGNQPLADLVIANPLPAGLLYRSAAQGSPAPEVSADGRTYAPLAALRVGGVGGQRAATADDVTHLRWRLARPLTPGEQGRFAFQAILK